MGISFSLITVIIASGMTTSPNFHIVVPKVLENAYKSVQHFIKISFFF